MRVCVCVGGCGCVCVKEGRSERGQKGDGRVIIKGGLGERWSCCHSNRCGLSLINRDEYCPCENTTCKLRRKKIIDIKASLFPREGFSFFLSSQNGVAGRQRGDRLSKADEGQN